MFDTIIEYGTIIDGTGSPGYQADLGIDGTRISAIGDLSDGDAHERVDARGLTVAPGFIDMHTHSDFTLVVNGKAESQIHQGVTTEVVGQCGYSCAPARYKSDIPKNTAFGFIPGHVRDGWQSFGDYFNTLEQSQLSINVAAFIGHGSIYRAIIGDDLRLPDPEEIDQMALLVDEAMEEGAAGLSTGLEYWPGNQSLPEHIVPLCKVASKYDRLYATHVRNRDLFYDLGFGEAIATSRTAESRLQISHIQPKYGAPSHAMEHALEMINSARKYGLDVAFDVIPHDWNHTLVMAILPKWVLEGGVKKITERLNNLQLRQRIKANRNPMWLLVADQVWSKIVLLNSRQNAELVGENFEDIGKMRGMDPYDAVLDLLLEEGEDMQQLLWTSHAFRQADIDLCLQQKECAVISDTLALAPYGELSSQLGSPSGYGWTSEFLSRYIRERNILSLEEGVRRLTSLPAERLRLKNRGVLCRGFQADIVVFNPETINSTWTTRSPRSYPVGIEHVYVNGLPAISKGQRTSCESGTVLRF